MSDSWKWKSLGSLVLIILAVYLLVPSIPGFRDNENWYQKFFPDKAINLGLDLRGGLYMELETDLEGSLKNRVDYLITQLEQALAEKAADITFLQNPDHSIRVTSKPEQKGILHQEIKENFSDAIEFPVNSESAEIVLKLKENYAQFLKTSTLKQALEAVRNRVDRYGVSEASVQLQGSDRIVVEVPGVKDPDRVIDLIRKTGLLEFKLVDESISQNDLRDWVKGVRTEKQIVGVSKEDVANINAALKEKLPEESEINFEIVRDSLTKDVVESIPYLIKKKTDVTGDMLKNAQVNIVDNLPRVSLAFDKRGAKNFGELTKNNVGKRLAIILDGAVSSAPNIDEPILSGQAEVRLGYGDYQTLVKEAEDLTLVLREGALPTAMTVGTKTLIGPSLGEDSINQALKALMIAALVVIVFMMIYYRWSGVVANLALVINILLLFAGLAALQASLSLPGMAGIVLTIGMAVDANIIIFERMREEKRLGKGAKAVIESGYDNAMSAIIDSNLTTLICGVVLYQFGTGPIKGFATTLMIGIITTLFSAIVVTRLIYEYFIFSKKIKKVSV